MNASRYDEMNRYDEIASQYAKSDAKPDKQFSILPTVLRLAGDVKDKVCVDAGCGNGFFTRAVALQGAKKVIGIDNSEEQIHLARAHPMPNIEYVLGDIFEEPLPSNDICIAPFVLNFPTTKPELERFVRNVHASLLSGGRLVAVLDDPGGADLRRFGAKKFIAGEKIDEAPITIELYDKHEKICTLHSTYFSPSTVETVLISAGFGKVTWHKPAVSEEGIKKFGENFWQGYVDNPELAYLVAEKIQF